ncbi:KTSC domain-containing protein [Arthrobacter pityocampae]|uniref:KTSC domain-containing protein n=1 Tax=Arthrobacter pityocampae TaxID=547334 RepID=A0A2S5IUW9_9MICC|nr:KTSC domain-containing protein [Arthrobacter pityocampae]PPB48372.1 KTSC domain-containing protein [Arthrobacter pityocampae]
MKRVPVESSNLVSVGYDAQIGTLEVEFKHRRFYRYFNVPPDVFDALIEVNKSGKSVGTYFDLYVKKVGYRYHEL